MKNILIINTHEPYPVSPGKLNNRLVERAVRQLTEKGFEVRTTSMKEAFDNKDQYLFQGKSVDDLFFPMHINFRFFGMEATQTFVCHDVMKNPDIENDLKRFDAHLNEHFQVTDHAI